jgi:hypothetical protein
MAPLQIIIFYWKKLLLPRRRITGKMQKPTICLGMPGCLFPMPKDNTNGLRDE